MIKLEIGRTYMAHRQGRNITPLDVSVTIVWICDDTVYYSLEGEQQVKQTTVSRFEEIISD